MSTCWTSTCYKNATTHHRFHIGQRYICNLICHILDISPVEDLDHADNTKQKTNYLKVTDSIKVVYGKLLSKYGRYV